MRWSTDLQCYVTVCGKCKSANVKEWWTGKCECESCGHTWRAN